MVLRGLTLSHQILFRVWPYPVIGLSHLPAFCMLVKGKAETLLLAQGPVKATKCASEAGTGSQSRSPTGMVMKHQRWSPSWPCPLAEALARTPWEFCFGHSRPSSSRSPAAKVSRQTRSSDACPAGDSALVLRLQQALEFLGWLLTEGLWDQPQWSWLRRGRGGQDFTFLTGKWGDDGDGSGVTLWWSLI